MLRRTIAFAVALASVATTARAAVASADICASAEFQALTPATLGASPLLVRSLVKGDQICLEFELSATAAPADSTWFAVGLASSTSMVNTPVSNVMLFQKSVGKPESYVVGGYSSSDVTAEPDQSFFAVHEASTATSLKFSYQRTLAPGSTYDVAINAALAADFIWAYGSSWPISGHKSGTKGSEKYNFVTGVSSAAPVDFCEGRNCAAIVGGTAFVVMLVGGFVLTSLLRKTPLGRAMLQKTLASPPVKSTTNAPVASPVNMVHQNLADLRLGEVLVVLIFAGAVAALVILNANQSEQVTTGQVALLVMMFMILPVTRIPLWSFSFGSSFERVVKFHRWLGMALAIATIVHLIMAIEVTNLVTTTKYGEVVPLWGFLAFVTFMLIGLTANEFMRRKFFDVFYVSHRVLSILGFVFTILHCAETIGVALAVPLVFYVLGLFNTWTKSMAASHEARVSVHEGTTTTTLVLKSTVQTQRYAQEMNMCSYFWVKIPSVSGFQWHPFSAIVTPNGDSIGFCVRAMGENTFTKQLLEHAQSTPELTLNLCGPFGKVAVDVDDYDCVVLIGGGVGITPLLSAINQRRLFAPKTTKAADWSILWSVRHPEDLLMTDELSPSHGQLEYAAASVQDAYANAASSAPSLNVTWYRHCSEVSEDGAVTRANGEQIAYRGGMPVLDEYINTGRYMRRKVCVLVCGPPTMVVAAQALARECGFDFHKEVFNW